jgi:two-component system phosphate regulon sensor histidine kinase PhoR
VAPLPRISFRRLVVGLLLQAALLAGLYLYFRKIFPDSIQQINNAFLVAAFFAVLVAAFFAFQFSFAGAGRLVALERDLERKADQLSSAADRLQALLENFHFGVVLVNTDGEVLLANRALQELFALSSGESQAASLPALLRHYQFVDLWRRAAQTTVTLSLTAEVPQSKRYVRASVYPLSGNLAGHSLLIFEDVTELRRLETVRRDFVSNVSHELRTPLTSLKALTESLRSGALEEPETAKRFLGHIETEVDALSELVSELLELARIESQRSPVQREPSDPCQILERGSERLRLQAERAGLSLNVVCNPGLPLILADPPRLEQVLVNLIHNAVKFTPKGGMIEVTAARKNGAVEFSVRDSGVGISEDDIARVFERFYKTDPARNKSGTGLGLAIARHLVEAHDGQIGLESKENQGSRFWFTIPTANRPTAHSQ